MSQGDEASHQESSVKLLIKNPYSQVAAVQVDVDLGKVCTVLGLKRILEEEYPSNPAPKVQRIIYFGKLLANEDLLSDVFLKTDLSEPQTLHLLIPVPPKPPTEKVTTPPPESSRQDQKSVSQHDGGQETVGQTNSLPSLAQTTHAASPESAPLSDGERYEQLLLRRAEQHRQRIYEMQRNYYQSQFQMATMAGLAGAVAPPNFASQFRSNAPTASAGTFAGDSTHMSVAGAAAGAEAAAANAGWAQSMQSAAASPTSGTFSFPSGTGGGVSALALLHEEDGDGDGDGDFDDQIVSEHFAQGTESQRTTNEGAGDHLRRRRATSDSSFHDTGVATTSPTPGLSSGSNNGNKSCANLGEYQDQINRLERCYADLMVAIDMSEMLHAQFLSRYPGPFQNYANQQHQHQYYHQQERQEELDRFHNSYTDLQSAAASNSTSTMNANRADGTPIQERNDQTEDAQQENNAEQPDNRAAPPNRVDARARGAPAGHGLIIIDLRLILKLAIMVYVLSSDTSSLHFYGLVAFSVIFYFYETGLLEPIIGTRVDHAAAFRNLRLHQLGQIVPVDQAPSGLLIDTYYLMKTFLLSMIPSYQIEATAIQEPSVPVAENGNQQPAVPVEG